MMDEDDICEDEYDMREDGDLAYELYREAAGDRLHDDLKLSIQSVIGTHVENKGYYHDNKDKALEHALVDLENGIIPDLKRELKKKNEEWVTQAEKAIAEVMQEPKPIVETYAVETAKIEEERVDKLYEEERARTEE